MKRFRIAYAKTEPLRYTGNLDLQKIWERFLRRADLPIAYSQGFHPQPRIQQACPLALGFLSPAEIADIFLDEDRLLPDHVHQALIQMPYPGIEIEEISEVSLTEPSLSTRVLATEVTAEFFDPIDEQALTSGVNLLLSAKSLPRTRRYRQYDLRPLIEHLDILPADGQFCTRLSMTLAARQGATGRPEEVLSALGFDPYDARYTRIGILFSNG
jgi:radical SAM-linked protein